VSPSCMMCSISVLSVAPSRYLSICSFSLSLSAYLSLPLVRSLDLSFVCSFFLSFSLSLSRFLSLPSPSLSILPSLSQSRSFPLSPHLSIYLYIYISLSCSLVLLLYLSLSLSLSSVSCSLSLSLYFSCSFFRCVGVLFTRLFLPICEAWLVVPLKSEVSPGCFWTKNVIHFSICACHPCAGAMLIFSVSFQF
jgi:hypothetical protein